MENTISLAELWEMKTQLEDTLKRRVFIDNHTCNGCDDEVINFWSIKIDEYYRDFDTVKELLDHMRGIHVGALLMANVDI